MVLRMDSIKPIATVDDFVAAMGGTGETAKWAGTTDSCVSNWIARGYLPPGYHMRALLWLHAHGLTAKPTLFDITEDELAKLIARPIEAAVASVVAA